MHRRTLLRAAAAAPMLASGLALPGVARAASARGIFSKPSAPLPSNTFPFRMTMSNILASFFG